jgi:hypothetical protein
MAMLLGLAVFRLPAQPVTTAKAGLVSFTMGTVYIDNQPVRRSPTHFPTVKENSTVRTENGRAEVLLAPCMVLRIGEYSAIRMIDSRLIDTRIELVAGSAVADIGTIGHHTSLTLMVKRAAVVLARPGTYHLDVASARLRVFEGRAIVQDADQSTVVAGGNTLTLDPATAPVKFDKTAVDSLDLWNRGRSAFLNRSGPRQRLRDSQALAAAAATASASAAAPTSATSAPPPQLSFPPRPASSGCTVQ